MITDSIPNSETILAMLETEQILNDPSTTKYDVEDALKKLKEYSLKVTDE